MYFKKDPDTLNHNTGNPLNSSYETDVIRLIGQHLISLGLKQTVERLLEESGLKNLDHPIATKLQHHILAGNLDSSCIELVDEIVSYSDGDKETNKNEILLMIKEQKFLELIEDNEHVKALKCLRLEITPLIEKLNNLKSNSDVPYSKITLSSSSSSNAQNHHSKSQFKTIERIKYLAGLLLLKSMTEVKSKANWPGKGLDSRQKLVERIQSYIPPPLILPPKRLSVLLSQATQLQREKCKLHLPSPNEQESSSSSSPTTKANGANGSIPNSSDHNSNKYLNSKQHEFNSNQSFKDTSSTDNYVDLKSDHCCSADNFPLYPRQELHEHKSEIWFCKFSPNGKMLATAGLGGKIRLWDLNPATKLFTEPRFLDCNGQSITCLSWCPNSIFLLACGGEDRPDLWIWNVQKGDAHNIIKHDSDESLTTCSWHPNGLSFAAASVKGNFNIYDLDGNKSGCREGVRVQCLSYLNNDPNIILAADSLNRIKAYAIKDMSMETDETDIIEEKYPIMSFIIDKNDKYIAINLVDQGVHLWDYRSRTLLRTFVGVCQRNFMIYSSFSSPEAKFLASGSEDGRVYIYHVNRDEPVAIVYGHTRCVNCVSWNPIYPELLVSVSDDRRVRLWGPMIA